MNRFLMPPEPITNALLRMDDRSRTGLAWVQHWAR